MNEILNVLVNGVNLVAYVEWATNSKNRTIVYKHISGDRTIFNDFIECENEEVYTRKIVQLFSQIDKDIALIAKQP